MAVLYFYLWFILKLTLVFLNRGRKGDCEEQLNTADSSQERKQDESDQMKYESESLIATNIQQQETNSPSQRLLQQCDNENVTEKSQGNIKDIHKTFENTETSSGKEQYTGGKATTPPTSPSNSFTKPTPDPEQMDSGGEMDLQHKEYNNVLTTEEDGHTDSEHSDKDQYNDAPETPGIIKTDQWKEEVQTALQNNNPSLAAKKAQEYLDWVNNVSLNIAITGESGSGKSTLVNALRGIKNKTEGAAPTSAVETTMKPTEYPHPKNPNIKIWDLPGVCTTNFKAEEYLQQVEFEKYDFFIIVCNNRFKENDAKLAQEIQRRNKKFYFVRSKIDQNIQGEKECDPNLNVEDLLKTIRDDCIKGLQDLGIQSPKVFLVSGLNIDLYDFENLNKTFQEELPKLKQDELILTWPLASVEVIEQKKKDLRKKIKWYTLASGVGAAVPIPGISGTVDLSMIITFTKDCRSALGLTFDSLEKLSSISNVPVEDLTAEVKSPMASSSEITEELVLKVLSMSAACITAMAVEEGARIAWNISCNESFEFYNVQSSEICTKDSDRGRKMCFESSSEGEQV